MKARRVGMRAAWALGAVMALGALGCTGDGPSGSVAPPPPPTPPPPLDVSGWVTAVDGDLPLVIVAPHGGEQSPADLPDRTCGGCETVNDANTRELSTAIADAFFQRTGRRPFLVQNRLHRRKFDANRDLGEATNSYAPLAPLWQLFHSRIDSAKVRALRVHPRALLIDLHGHAHAIPRLELGYLLSGTSLRLPDSLLTPLMMASSVAGLDASSVSGDSGVALLRGTRSLGARLADAGFRAVPSPAEPAPDAGDAYFSGGFNTQRHGSLAGGRVDAVQVECNYAGVRDTPTSRAAFAEAFVTATLQYLADHYGWSPSP